jgi:hypothetical protein
MEVRVKTSKQFVGTWKCADDDSSLRVVISMSRSGEIRIRAYDSCDGEELKVSSVKVTPRTVRFDCMVPSTGYQTRNSLVLQTDGSCKYKLTTFEKWVKTNKLADV